MITNAVNNNKKLVERAKYILRKNWNGRFTVPSPTLYPHQWSWDSCFIAIGKSYFDTEQAMKEMYSLFAAQWKNGMIPHIIFDKTKKTYFPGADFYETTRSQNAPKNIQTSGMTSPPVQSITCYYIYQNANDRSKVKDFLKNVYPKLMAFHGYLKTNRDPENTGLITILHPWESGLDNSPVWDEPFSRITIKKDLPRFKRLDIAAVEGRAEVRPSQWMYRRFIYLVQLMKKFNYDEKKMYEHSPFKIKDIVFTSIFYVANKYLERIAHILGAKDNDIRVINNWKYAIEQNFYKYFFPSQQLEKRGIFEERFFYDYDLNKKDWLKSNTIISLIPIFTGLLHKEDAEVILRRATHAHFCGNGYCHVPTIPSTDVEVSYFKPMMYWRGPVWINANWMLWLGMLKYGYVKEAELIRNGVFELAKNHGFREYYDPLNGKGLGGKNFSWTAALTIDMIMNTGIGTIRD